MKVLLLNPPFLPRYSRSSRSPCVTKGGTFYYPYYLAYAAGVIDKEFDTVLKDAIADELTQKETVQYVKKEDPSLVVIDTGIPSFGNDVMFAEKIKEATNAHVTLVGNHSLSLKKSFQFSEKIDSVCRGEYDYTVRDLARTLKNGRKLSKVKGLSFRKKGKIVDSEDRPLIQNLDELPWVSKVYKNHFGIEGIKKYFYASLRHPQITILSARGCPNNCSFCPIGFKKSYRVRSAEDVVAEFKWIEKNLPKVKEIMLEDPTFGIKKKRVKKICSLLIKENFGLKWSCNARVNMEKETLKKMKDAGCRLLCVGFETPSQFILNKIRKGTTERMQLQFTENCRNVGLLVNGCFILGLLGDSKESMKQTIQFAKKLSPDTAQFYPLMCYPGTKDYERAKEEGKLESEEFSALLDEQGRHHTNVKGPNDMSSEELVRWCDRARKEFYLRKSYIFYKLKQSLTNWQEAKRTVKSARTFFKYMLK